MSFQLSKRSRERLKGVHPKLIQVIERAIIDSPYDFGIPPYGGLRTSNNQAELYSIGRTKEIGRKPVTHVDGVNKESNHQIRQDGYGHAFDIYIYLHEEKRASWDIYKLTEVAKHIMKIADSLGVTLFWGGNYKNWKDYPHFELKSYK